MAALGFVNTPAILVGVLTNLKVYFLLPKYKTFLVNKQYHFMRKIYILLLFVAILAKADSVSAGVNVAGSSAQLKRNVGTKQFDYRKTKLENYLAGHNSPITPYSLSFIKYSDKYNIDWRLVPAISGVESTFGKRIPFNSYNAYGWANGKYQFTSWDDSIFVVSKALREKYYDRGATNIAQIARRYAPPSNSWGGKVKFFMRKIDILPLSFSLEG